MGRLKRAFARGSTLAILVFFLLLVPRTPSEVALASDTDGSGPESEGLTYRMLVSSELAERGLTLIAPYNQANAYLVDDDGRTVHTWRADTKSAGTVELLPDGTLLRGRAGLNGQPPGIQLLDWDGAVLWDYVPPDGYTWHHDVEPMPNGNFLINTVVSYTRSEVTGMGRSPSITSVSMAVDPILEIRPNGTYGGDVVWEWDPVDHIVQDYNASKPNYGAVKDHPELIDINYPHQNVTDWQHANAVAYNAELDQVMLTSRNFDEIWVIDHGTTTEEAAGHTGGSRGRGGDLLYRWGNPKAYDAGDDEDQVLYGPHDGHWIGRGLPGEGNIIAFNNGLNALLVARPDGRYSTIEELVPPLDGTGGDYERETGSAFGPADSTWRYRASPATDFFAWSMGGVERLPDGNTLVCGGSTGETFEVDPAGDVAWEHTSAGLFKASRYYPPVLRMDGGLQATEDVASRVDLSAYTCDPDTDMDGIGFGTDSPFASVTGHELRLLYPEGVTTDVVNISAGDGIFKVVWGVRVNVTPVNDPPHLAWIPEVAAVEGVPYALDLTAYVTDPDDGMDRMVVTEDSPYATVEGAGLRLLYPDGVLGDRFLVTVSDGEFESSTEVRVTVEPVNDPPAVGRIPDQHCVEDVPWVLDLGPLVTDVDSPKGALWVATDSPYASLSGWDLTLLYPDGVTWDVVRLTVSDGEDATVAAFNVSVEPVNDPPVIDDLSPVTVREDTPSYLDLDPVVDDVDTPREQLVLGAHSPFVEVEGLVLRLLYATDVGRDEVALEVWDGELRTSCTLVVLVVPVNDPPAIGDLSPMVVTEDVPAYVDLGTAVLDEDTPGDQLSLVTDSPYVTADGLTLRLLYPDGVLHDEVTVEVWDGELFASATLVVDVGPVNDPPWWAQPPDVTATEDVEDQLVLDTYIHDVDTPMDRLRVEADSPYGTVEGHVLRFVYPEGVAGETVTLTLSDGEHTAVVRLNVTVLPVNDAPELADARASASVAGSYRFSVVFKDVDTGARAPDVEVVVDGVAHACARDGTGPATYGDGVVFSIELDLEPGIHVFHFVADDGDGGSASTESLMVEVGSRPGGVGPTTALVLVAAVGAAATAVGILYRRRGGSGANG